MTPSAHACSTGVRQARRSAVETGRCSAFADLAVRLVCVIGPPLISEAEILYPECFGSTEEKI